MASNEVKSASLVAAAIAAVAAGLLVMSSFKVVEPGHRGVRVTMGKVGAGDRGSKG